MRLIDADNFKILVTAVAIADGYDAGFVNEFCKFIDRQPTAYDVDRVVEQLGKKNRKDLGDPNSMWYNFGIWDAISIVKRGMENG